MLKRGLISLLMLAGCQNQQTAEAPAEPKIQVAAAQNLIQAQPDLVILDVRTPGEYAAGHLKQARLLDFQSPAFRQELNQLDRKQPYLLYCASGNRSGQALALMKQQGFERVYDLQGGIQAWQRDGGALVQ